jgi:SAM-dependent methyltransferase
MMSRRAFLISVAASALPGQQKGPPMFGNAEAYERFMGRWSRVAAPLVVNFAGVPQNGRVLDVGAGTGSLAFEIARQRRGIQVTGIDPSPEYVAYAAANSVFQDRVAFQTGDAQRTDLQDAMFDCSVSLFVFNFIPDALKALREVRRVTKPNGTISAAVWDYGGRMRMLRAFWDAAIDIDIRAEKADEKHMPLCRSGELSRLWKQGGLEEIHEESLEPELAFGSFADYWEPFLLGQGPAGAYVRTLSSDRVQALRRAVIRRLELSSEDKPFALAARLWVVRGLVPVR